MSNSPRAKARRSKRSRCSKHERTVMAKQHWGNKHAHQIAELKASQ